MPRQGATAARLARRSIAWPLVLLLLAAIGLLPTSQQQLLVAAMLGVFAAALAAVHPGPALAVLVVLVPIQVHLLSLVYRLGLPGDLVRGLGQFKEAILVGLVVAAIRQWRTNRHRADRLDRAALAFVGLVASYAVAPILLGPIFTTVFPTAPTSVGTLITATRDIIALVVVLLAVRSLELSIAWRSRVVMALIGIATVVAVGGVIEFFWNDLWHRFEVSIGFARYHVEVLGIPPPAPSVTSVILGRSYLRAGSTLGQLTLGFFLLTGVGLQLARVAEGFRPTAVARLGLMVTATVVTITRSSVLALVVTVFVALWSTRSTGLQRPRMVVVAVIGLGVLVVGANESGFTDRTLAAIRGDDPSATTHVERSSRALEQVVSEPLGRGLGAPGVASAEGEQIPAENAYLSMATEIGIAGALLFLWFAWRLLVALWQGRRDPLSAGMVGALAGLLVGGMLLHAWTNLATSWTIMAAAGLCLPRQRSAGPADNRDQGMSEPDRSHIEPHKSGRIVERHRPVVGARRSASG